MLRDPRFPLIRQSGFVSNGDESGADRTMIGFTDPFHDEEVLTDYDRVYGTAWRAFILWLKYWKRVALESLPKEDPRRSAPWSYLFENAAMYALDDHGRTLGGGRPVEFIERALSRKDLYPHELLALVPGFGELCETLTQLCKSGLAPASTEARQLIARVFPVPPVPAQLITLDPAWFIEAQLIRGSLCNRANDHAGVFEILQATWDAFPDRQEVEIAMPLAYALIQKGQRLAAAGRRSEARAAYRSVADRYAVSVEPEVIAAVIEALEAEWELCEEDSDTDGLVAVCEYAVASFGARTRAAGEFFLVTCLHNTAAACANAGRPERGLRFCLEARRRFKDSTRVPVQTMMTSANFMAGRLARTLKDLPLAIELFEAAAATKPEPDDSETASLIGWARFEKADCLARQRHYDEAVSECEKIIATGATSRHAEQVACARLLAAMCLPPEREDGPQILQGLMRDYEHAPGPQLKVWLSRARHAVEQLDAT
jgi:tetratricopeptide (TPR) repeat protein